MSFLQPWMLLGLGAAALPIVIHLIFRRRPRKLPFPALELLMKSARRVENRWRLRRILLLAARVLALSAFVFAAAGPNCADEPAVANSSTGPVRLAIVVDASFSMRAEYDGRTAFTRAIQAAERRVGRMGPSDRGLLVVGSARPEVIIQLTSSRAELLRALGRLEPTWGGGDLGQAISLAARALTSDDEGSSARVRVYSDFARNSVRSATDLDVELELVDVVPTSSPRDNVTLSALDLRADPSAGTRSIRFDARLRSYGEPDDVQVPVALYSGDDRLEGSRVRAPPDSIADVSLRHTFDETGSFPVRVVVGEDRLPEDNIRFAYARVQSSLSTLLVNGAPSGLPKRDELYYLDNALRAGMPDHPPPVSVNLDRLDGARLEASVVVLAGVPRLDQETGSRLVRYVEAGGGLLVSVSAATDPDALNRALGPLLPRPFRGLKRMADDLPGSETPPRLEVVQRQHPIVQVFEGEGLEGLTTTETRGRMLLEPGAGPGLEVVLAFQDGQPALVAHSFGRGRVLIMLTSIDRDLTDLAIRPGFVPLMRRSLLWLGRKLDEARDDRVTLGSVHRLRLPQGVTAAIVEDPDGETTTIRAELDGYATYVDARRPGHHDVSVPGRPDLADELDFAVNLDGAESDLAAMDPNEVRALLSGPEGRAAFAGQSDGGFDPKALAALALAVMALSFTVEGLLTLRGGL